MGGSGGGGTFYNQSPGTLREQIRQAELDIAEAQFTPKLAKRLSDILAVTHRDTDATTARLDAVKAILKDNLVETYDLRFGGSVAKHTYVDGLSDVDMLLTLRSPEEMPKPSTILDTVIGELAKGLPRDIEVKRGRIAITLKYSDESEIQLVPAVRNEAGLHVPAWEKDTWSAIKPEGFQKALRKVNDKCDGKLIPTIKLAKAINATLPEMQQLSGYHMESLAIDAFKKYDGPKVAEKMLPYLFKRAAQTVLTPIKDSTGQSVHVDSYLGASNSKQRQQMALLLDRIARRMENATAAQSMEQWNAILGEL